MRKGILNSTISGETHAAIIPQQLYWFIILKRSSSVSPDGNFASYRKWTPTSICLLNSLDKGVTLIGGCCEIKPRHIEALKTLF